MYCVFIQRQNHLCLKKKITELKRAKLHQLITRSTERSFSVNCKSLYIACGILNS